MKIVALITLAICFSFTSKTFAQHDHNTDYDRQHVNLSTSIYPFTELKKSDFEGWTEMIKSTTGKAHKAFGKPLNVRNYKSVSESNIEEIAMTFIADNQNELGVKAENIEYQNAHYVLGKWYVHLSQVVEGLDVVFSSIDLRINDKAQVFSFGVEYYDVSETRLEPKLKYEQAIQKEISNVLGEVNMKNNKQSVILNSERSGEIYAFPVYKYGRFVLEAAYRAEYTEDLITYGTYISAVSGETLYRNKLSHNFNTKVNVSGLIKETSSLDEEVNMPFSNLYVNVDGEQYTTDINGNFELDIDEQKEVEIEFKGPWVDFQNTSYTQGKISTIIYPDQENEITWNNENSSLQERMVIYHLNYIRDYFKSMDSTKTSMDFQMTLRFEDSNPQIGDQPNAYSSGRTIGFTAVQNESMNLPETPAVLYHEYGHSINMLLYEELGQQGGMINQSAHEGIADITGALIIDDPRVGYGAFTNDPDRLIRNCDNTLKYPDDIQGDSHHDGQIIAGAFWDLRTYTDLETVKKLAHFSRYGLPDDEDNGICFSEWLLEVLIADDDDGDLTNKTPNYESIIRAFDNHNINFSGLLSNSLVHTPVEDMKETKNIIPIEVTFTLPDLFKGDEDNIELLLNYSFDDFKVDTISVKANGKNGDELTFGIENAPDAGKISYFFSMTNSLTGEVIEPLGNQNGIKNFSFVVGYEDIFIDRFQEDFWEFSHSPDGLKGMLEIGVPQVNDMSQFGLGIFQNGDSEDEDNICLVTGAEVNEQAFWENGIYQSSYAISPIIDLSGAIAPIFKFKLWDYKFIFEQSTKAILNIEISDDGGETWIKVFEYESNKANTGSWLDFSFNLNEIDLNSTFRYKVNVNVENFQEIQGQPSIFAEYMVDDVRISDITSSIQTAPKLVSLKSPKNETESKTNVDIQWYSTLFTDTYQLQISEDENFSSTLVEKELLSPKYNLVNLKYNVTYYWRVQAKNSIGVSPWSEIWSFTTENVSSPNLIYPLNNSENVLKNTSISWTDQGSEVKYRLNISKDTKFKSIDIDMNSDFSSVNVNLEVNQTYFWRVKSITETSESDWSEVFSFKVQGTTSNINNDIISNVKVFPNPFNTEIQVEGEIRNLEILDVSGKTIIKKSYDNKSKTNYKIDTSILPSGSYFLLIDNNIYKLIKQ